MGTRRPNQRSSIYLGKDGFWHGWVTIGVKADGSPDRRHRMGKTEAEVTRKVRELEGQRASGYMNQPGLLPTVAEWLAEYLDVLCERLVLSEKMAPRTLADYRSKTRNWINPLLGKHRLDRLTPEHLDTAYATMLRRGLSPSTVLKVHRILSRALRVAVRRGRITRNAAALVDAPSAAPHEIEPLTREEARHILDVAATRRNGARWSVALALGIRQGEALGLRWSYVDLETGVIRAWFQIQRVEWRHGCDDPHACGERWHRRPCKPKCKRYRHLPACGPGCMRKGHVCYKRPCPADCTGHAAKCPSRVGGGVVFRQRKGKGRLTLQCPPALLELLREHRKRQALERLRAGSSWTDHDLVFATRRGGPIERTEDWRTWKAMLRQAQVRDGAGSSQCARAG
jgi:integrase